MAAPATEMVIFYILFYRNTILMFRAAGFIIGTVEKLEPQIHFIGPDKEILFG